MFSNSKSFSIIIPYSTYWYLKLFYTCICLHICRLSPLNRMQFLEGRNSIMSSLLYPWCLIWNGIHSIFIYLLIKNVEDVEDWNKSSHRISSSSLFEKKIIFGSFFAIDYLYLLKVEHDLVF